uniref:Tubulin-specific chaperone A n=1 Tax=Mastacembelus armatus TaxID=205130 RepID=A0A3Q3L965_9TELE
MADQRIRQIKIKTGIVKRLAKEKIAYITEAKQQEEKIERLKAEAGDDYVIKKQMEVLQESRMMIPDCHRRLTVAYGDLQQLLVSNAVKWKHKTNQYLKAEQDLKYLPFFFFFKDLKLRKLFPATCFSKNVH